MVHFYDPESSGIFLCGEDRQPSWGDQWPTALHPQGTVMSVQWAGEAPREARQGERTQALRSPSTARSHGAQADSDPMAVCGGVGDRQEGRLLLLLKHLHLLPKGFIPATQQPCVILCVGTAGWVGVGQAGCN